MRRSCSAAPDRRKPAPHGVTALLVPMDLPGITRSRFDCHGQRAIGRGSLFFENVRVPASHRLGEENKGFVQVMQGFDFSRALIGLQVLAVARVALEETWAHVVERQAFGSPCRPFRASRIRSPISKRRSRRHGCYACRRCG